VTVSTDPYLPGHGDPTFAVRRYELDLDYRLHTNRLSGHATITAVALDYLRTFTLDLAGLEVTKVSVNGRPSAGYAHRGSRLEVRTAMPVEIGQEFTVVVAYHGHPKPVPGPWGEAGWEELTDGVIVAAQPHGAPSWFPCNDRPADKASYRISVTAPTGYHVAANGELVSTRRRASAVTWVYEQAEPMASYLATVQIGRYVPVDLDGVVPIELLVPHRRLDRARAGFGRLPAMMAAFVDLFGPYPFGSYRVVVTDEELEIPLEAQGMAIFGTNFLTDDWSAQRLVAHELAHQWFGNSVTLEEWRDIWLHEGFACYAEWLWSELSGQRSTDDHARNHWRRLNGLPQDIVLGDPGSDDMFDDRVYKRGALLLHALRLTIGDDAFRTVLREWVARHAQSTATTSQFISLAEEISGRDLGDLFDRWLLRPALPALPKLVG
jgi:aminopeptidase N